MRGRIREARGRFERVLCLYGDCGTGGMLDRVLAEEGVQRIDGAHCYEFYAGAGEFAALHDAEPGTFYLTDYLVRHFDALVIPGGYAPDLMRRYAEMVDLVRKANAAGKVIAAIHWEAFRLWLKGTPHYPPSSATTTGRA